jgi:predicted DCC family thiol-disulfide oxidoreductase YuxK
MKHLVFYDGNCGFCDQSVQILLKLDKRRLFAFAPLKGETAAKFLQQISQEMQQADSLILVEDFQSNPKLYIMGKAILRIFWLLGGFWSLIGWMNVLPSAPFDFFYRIVARNRGRLFSGTCTLPLEKERDRFLK